MKKSNEKNIIDYDFKNDTLFLKKKGTKYPHSINFKDFTIDLDKKEKLCGIEILNVSKYFKLDKTQLHKIKEVTTKIEISHKRLVLDIICKYKYRNKASEKNLIYNDINTLINQNMLEELKVC